MSDTSRDTGVGLRGGHIPVHDAPDRDVYLNGELMDLRDTHPQGIQTALERDDEIVAVSISFTDDSFRGIVGERWDDHESAFWKDGQVLEFEKVETSSTDQTVQFESVDGGEYTVELREVA